MATSEIGYHASHEQFSPSSLIGFAKEAEIAGFAAINCSDHFHPWSEQQGHSGFTFAWLGAAMQATNLPFSSVCAPGERYHPAIVAQAVATLNEMFPGRYAISLGSGEAVNECITGNKWPEKAERNNRLKDSVEVIRRLLCGETVTQHSSIHVENARLYTLPASKPLLLGAAVTAQTARWMAGWVDGMITVSRPVAELQEVITAFREGGGAGKPIYLKVQLSFAETEGEAIKGAYEQWKTNVLPSTLLSDLQKVNHFSLAAAYIKPDDLRKMVHISAIRNSISIGLKNISL
ncbi:probable non-F420 flavinoid oxidoreductase [Pedobacter westerhofensis]|uniref:Probable non-F420 flavinoid oxidoreductase n=1 Tax=Pedobacter westerhofensis TaxID=425512 RepID=A0A521BB92_9SPHI|nr:TIGR03885 family FMN-dependent LLM class oxidoreductase [Pedobacter westerhofensis]SMO44339.1 probable non-F420 flavinoid oxidoreductase [Pedobacter westerhofensis]